MKQKVNTQNMILLAIVALFWFAQYVYIPYQTTYLTAAGAAGNVVGIVVGAYGISQLVLRLPAGVCADRLGRHKPFIMTGAAAAGAEAFCLALLLKEEKRNVSQSGATVPQLLQVCRGRRILVFSLIALIQQGIQLTTAMSFTSQILKDYGASDSLVGISSIIYMVSAVCFSAMASSKLCEKHGPKFWIPAVLAVLAVYCILVPASGSIPVILALQVLPGMATGILFSYATSEAMKGVPEEKRSTAMGFFQAVYAIGMTAFPMFTGSIVSAGGMEAGYLVLAGIAAAGIIIAKVYYHREKGRDR